MLSLIIKITIISQQRIIIHYKVFKIILQDKLAKNDRRFNFPNSLVPIQTRETQFSLDNHKAFHLKQFKLLRSTNA